MLYGSQEPSLRFASEYEETDGNRAEAFMRKAGKRLMPWQASILDDWLAMGWESWVHSSAALNVPRQNGKTALVVARAAFGMARYGEWVVYTSHLQKTSTETFEEMLSIFEAEALKSRVKAVKTALGREEIVLKNGGRCKFLARTRNGGRGQHGDLWIADEYQELTDEQQGSFLPLLSASKRPQAIYCGTPPDENASGEVFYRLRDKAQSDEPGLAYAEWGVQVATDTADESAWAKANPSLGRLIKIETIRTEHSQMAEDRFARERLGKVTGKVEHIDHPISMDDWKKCETDDPPQDGSFAYAVKFAPDGSGYALAGCVNADGRPPHVEVIDSADMSRGLSGLTQWLADHRDRASVIVIDGASNAQTLAKALMDNKVKKSQIVMPSARIFTAATSGFVNAVKEGNVTHYDDSALDDSATCCGKRKIGKDGAFGFSQVGDADPMLIEACCLAHWGVLERGQKRRTGVCF